MIILFTDMRSIVKIEKATADALSPEVNPNESREILKMLYSLYSG